MNQDEFDRFLSWLHPDREEAGKLLYEKIRPRLIYFFLGRHCADAEDQADETIDRVIRLVQEIADTYVGDRALYFYRVAKYVYLEYIKKNPTPLPMPQPDSSNIKEQRHDCLEECLSRLEPGSREMVLEYYREDKRAKIERRRELAERLGLNPNALRLQIYRIRGSLRECIYGCLEKPASSETD